MHLRRILITFLFTVAFGVAFGQKPCPEQNGIYSSYSKAVSAIRSYSFGYSDFADMSKSSWIKSAEYYSCTSGSGYLIVNLKSGESYIHYGVPAAKWNGFKSADSFGSYYNSQLKGMYTLKLAP
jgi:hypothetical protein